jgi:hypothetical protein
MKIFAFILLIIWIGLSIGIEIYSELKLKKPTSLKIAYPMTFIGLIIVVFAIIILT